LVATTKNASGQWRGLLSAEAAHRLGVYGPNHLKKEEKHTRLKEALGSLADPMAIMLVLASATYFLLGETRDGIILLIALVPVLGVDVLLESKSREALKKLAQTLSPTAQVIRNSMEIRIPSEQLVPGDLLLLKEGDKVHADGVLRECANFSVDESQLTGESEPVAKKASEHMPKKGWKEEQQFFAGSTVLSGQAVGEVLNTGLRTRLGKIAKLISESEAEPTPLQKKTEDLVKKLAFVALIVAVGVLGLELLRGMSFYKSLLSAVSLSIAAVPEEFPLVFILFLSLGAWRLSSQGVLVRRLASVETLGSTTVICVDKTGTLTYGKFQLDFHEPFAAHFTENAILEASVLACEPNPQDRMEKAILEHALESKVNVPHILDRWELVHDFDFDYVGKHMSHVWKMKTSAKHWRLVAKGAFEGILEHCEFAPGEREEAEKQNTLLATQGMRVLAVAGRDAESFTGDRVKDESKLKLYGFLGFRDPLRTDVPEAVEECQRAGIKIKILSGDHLMTAHAIADAAGIAHGPEDLLNGPDLDNLSKEEFAGKVNHGAIFARVRPDQKHAIVGALKSAGEIVAMAGDGINDAPALKLADIGIAMGKKGTEVARSSAQIVLLHDSFTAIVSTVREGRRIFANIQRSFFFLLAFHIPIVGLALLCPMADLPLLLLPVHLVWLELIIHPVSALVFEAEPAPPDVMRRPPRDPKAALLPGGDVWYSVLSGGLLTVAVLAFYHARLSEGVPYARSAGLAALIIGSLLLVWSERAVDKPWFSMPFPRTLRFWVVWVLVAVSLPVIIEVPFLASIFQVVPLRLTDWGIALGLAVVSIGWRAFGKIGKTSNH